MTVDGFCDHTAMNPDDEVLEHYNDLLRNSDTILYGRITYQLMENYWPVIVKNPTGDKPANEFAVLIENISKIVFSGTLKNLDWKNVKMAKSGIEEEVLELRKQEGKDILAGSRSLIVTLMNLNLIDEFQLCIHPIILGSGVTPLFTNIKDTVNLKLLKTKTFRCGSVVHYYKPTIK